MKKLGIILILILCPIKLLFCQSVRGWEKTGRISVSAVEGSFYDFYVGIYSHKFVQIYLSPNKHYGYTYLTWTCPTNLTIESAKLKKGNDSTLFILLSNGDVYKTEGSDSLKKWTAPHKVGSGVGSFSETEGQKIVGDALYVNDGSNIYISRDTAQTWQLDTDGLSGTVYDIAIDTNNYAWAATYDGVFTQHPDSNVWHKNSTFPSTNCRSIFVDRRGWIFVGTSGIFKSTDNGNTWANYSGQLLGQVTSFGDDAFGNVYAASDSGGFRSDGGTSAWVDITDSIEAFVMPSTGARFKNTSIFNTISGDTLLYAATDYGLFTSTDQGNNWSYDISNQLPAYQFYGVVRSGMYSLVSTGNGVYRIKEGDTAFTKVLPTTGFQGNITLSTDSAGNIYSIVPVPTGTYSSVGENYKSTDNGATWFRDSTGLAQFNIDFKSYRYNVDASGTQYARNAGGLWIKRQNEDWTLDTLGLNMSSGDYIRSITLNNKKGIVYAVKEKSYNDDELYSRPVNGSTWQQIDVSSYGSITLNVASDENGDMLLYTNKGDISRYDGTNWTMLTSVTANADSLYAYNMTVDRKGYIIGTFASKTNYTYKGLYYSSDRGVTWNYAGLDSTNITLLSTYGDTTFAITSTDGIYVFTTDAPTNIEDQSNKPLSFKLFQNYPNPFNPVTNIMFNIPEQAVVTIKIFDILGREVATILNKEMKPGEHQIQFNASGYSSGIYFYQIKSGNFIATKKLVLLK